MAQQQVYELGVWNLQELAPQGVETAVKEIEQKTKAFEEKRSLLAKEITADKFIELIKEYEDILSKLSKASAYARLWFSEDSSNQEASALQARTDHLGTTVENKLLFFPLWFQRLPSVKSKELIEASGKRRYFFEQLKKLKKYTLKENEEKIIAIKRLTGTTALKTVYDILTSQFEFEVNGAKVTQNEIMKLVRDPSAQKREEAYKALLTKYAQYKDAIGEIYRNIVQDWGEEFVGLRKYKNPIHARNISNDIPDKAVESLLETCEKNHHLFQRYFELKRQKIGLEKFKRFDLYAPIKTTQESIEYDSAVKLVLETFEKFSPEFKEQALRVVNGKHIHAKLQKNKDTGAFCASPSLTVAPYVLLNYTGNSLSVRTLAHELGHAVHYGLASKQTELTFGASLPLAETASVFAETLLFERLIERYPEMTQELVFSKIDDLYATIIRQAGFVAFEKKAHQMMHEGKTIKEMSEEYMQELRKQFGEKIEIDPLFANEWSYIPHIFQTPFYCYAYAFGNLLVLSLYELYKEQGQSFVPKVIELLSKGGSESPEEMTKAIGVNINSEKFWQKGFTVAEELLKKLDHADP